MERMYSPRTPPRARLTPLGFRPLIAAQPSSPKLGFIDCEKENIFCNSWSVGAPSLIKFRIPKPLADQSAPVPEFRYKPLNRTSTTTETFKELVINNQIDAIPPYEGLFHPSTACSSSTTLLFLSATLHGVSPRCPPGCL